MLLLIRGNFYLPTSRNGKEQEVWRRKEREGWGIRRASEADLEVFFWPMENLSSLLWDPSLEEKKTEDMEEDRKREIQSSDLDCWMTWSMNRKTEMSRWWTSTVETSRQWKKIQINTFTQSKRKVSGFWVCMNNLESHLDCISACAAFWPVMAGVPCGDWLSCAGALLCWVRGGWVLRDWAVGGRLGWEFCRWACCCCCL